MIRKVFTIMAVMWGSSLAAQSAPFQLWVTDPLTKALPSRDSPSSYPDAVRISAVRNEYESGQVVISASGPALSNLSVKITGFSGPAGPRPSAKLNRVGYVPIRTNTPGTPAEKLLAKAPASLPDPLLPLDGATAEQTKQQPIWITVHVPKEAKPGDYSAWLEVAASGQTARLPVLLRVSSVALPEERTLKFSHWFWSYNLAGAYHCQPWSEKHWQLLARLAQWMRDYRQNVVLTPIMELITATEQKPGELSFDFSQFDRWVELFQRAGVLDVIEGGHLGGFRDDWYAKDYHAERCRVFNRDGSLQSYDEKKVYTRSPEAVAFYRQFLPALYAHLKTKGWAGIYVQHIADEPIQENSESYQRLAALVHQLAPGIKTFDACMSTNLTGAIDIWIPLSNGYQENRGFFEQRRQAGDTLWHYTCCYPTGNYMNRFLDFPLLETRLLHWGNFKYNLAGYLHWGLMQWVADPFQDTERNHSLPPGDAHILYPDPARNDFLSSIRLEAMRDGIEDFELLRLLEKKAPQKARSLCDAAMQSFSEHVTDPAAFRKIRATLIAELEKAAP